ncbi:MAG TPA: hypothetical protein VIY29_00625 [Ktedonobacteraceae bacterium]
MMFPRPIEFSVVDQQATWRKAAWPEGEHEVPSALVTRLEGLGARVMEEV